MTKIKTMTKVNIVIGMISALFLGAAIFNAAFMTTPVSISVVPVQPKDVISPYVTINEPANGAEVSGEITVSTFAQDNQGVKSVGFYIDNLLKKIDKDSRDGWTMTWNTETHLNGRYIIKAIAYDAAGNQHISQLITITVKN